MVNQDLFNEKTIKKIILESNFTVSEKQMESAKRWISLLNKGLLDDEKGGYIEFANTFLRDVLGFEIDIEHLKHEEKHMEFLFKDSSGKAKVVFEVKGAKTKDLWASQSRTSKVRETPVNQIWDYMSREVIPYGVLTNYVDFVLFDRTKSYNTFYKFNLLEIEKNPEKLNEFIYVFSKDCLLESKKIEELIEESKNAEREFTKEFYKIFHEIRLMILKEFQDAGIEEKRAIHFSQLFLNRLMFIFFAEDRGLLERGYFEKVIFNILKNGEKTLNNSSYNIFDNILGIFEELDNKIPLEINGFNGELFKEKISRDASFKDFRTKEFFKELIQNSKLKTKENLSEIEKAIFEKYKDKLNPIIENIIIMASFDFKEQINVDILGHIFEQSISDLEELKNDAVSKRKKDGVFYTPEYITDYICRNTIIPYLSKSGTNEVGVLVSEYEKEIEELENKFKKIKILDPACGSGAFLIKSVDIMMEIFNEIQRVKQEQGEYFKKDWSSKKKQTGMQLDFTKFEEQDEIKEIIENSIFGVDINEESVEITKLALFLKLAKKGKKLINLSKNIKKGNSLISDKSVDERAFDWNDKKNGFGDILEQGGFDIVVGNPPYVKARDNEDTRSRKYIEKNYFSAYKMWDLYVPFIEKGSNLLKENGQLAMIIPDTIGQAEYTKKLVQFIEENLNLKQIDFFPNIEIFQNVGVENKIIFIKKTKEDLDTKRILHNLDLTNITILEKEKGVEKYNLSKKMKIKGNNINLGDILLVSYGLRLNSDKADKEFKFKKEDLVSEKKTEKNPRPYTEGKYLERYVISKKLFVEWGTERCPKRLVRATFPELYFPKKLLLSRQKRIATLSEEGEICDNTIVLGVKVCDFEGLDNSNLKKYFSNLTIERNILSSNSKLFDLKYILSLINSKYISYFLKNNSGGKIDTYPDDWKKIPIPFISPSSQAPFIEKADLMLEMNKELYEKKNKFLNRIKELGVDNISRKLDSFFSLSFSEFLGELEKQKVKLNLKQKEEWEDYFEERKKELSELNTKIDETDKEIDQMVYALYDLNEEEIKIVEGN